MNKAVEARLKSEHMKTELITNVSHDLKTPLTSIINYIDLLKKEQLDNPKADEYLEVLERQSARLKKLTEDVLEASKASTGNINIKLEPIDISELLTQAVGEYEERFAQSNLKPIICKPDYPCLAMADGALLWRVFDNLLSNICKYSQQHTRIFISLDESAHYFTVSLKNTSHDLLNISPDELMERFVRGDSSRNSEGSGLGLSIAQSLTALQNGTLSLDVDGDLFKTFIRLERYLQPYPAESDEQNI